MPDGQSRALGEGIERRRHRRGIWRISSYASSEREPWQWLRIVIAMATARGNRGVAQAVRTALEHVPPTEGWMGKAPPAGVHFWRRTCRDQAADALCRAMRSSGSKAAPGDCSTHKVNASIRAVGSIDARSESQRCSARSSSTEAGADSVMWKR